MNRTDVYITDSGGGTVEVSLGIAFTCVNHIVSSSSAAWICGRAYLLGGVRCCGEVLVILSAG